MIRAPREVVEDHLRWPKGAGVVAHPDHAVAGAAAGVRMRDVHPGLRREIGLKGHPHQASLADLADLHRSDLGRGAGRRVDT